MDRAPSDASAEMGSATSISTVRAPATNDKNLFFIFVTSKYVVLSFDTVSILLWGFNSNYATGQIADLNFRKGERL